MATTKAYRTLETKFITDLSGGLNDTNVAPLIKDSEAQTASNVFVNLRGGVEKRYGFLANTPPVTFSNTTNARALVYTNLTASQNDTVLVVVSIAVSGAGIAGSLASQVNNISNFNSVPYVGYPSNSGTAVFTQNSTTVTLSTGTAEWLTQIAANDWIQSQADSGSTWYQVASVTDNSNIVLTTAYAGSTNTSIFKVRQTCSTPPAKGVMFSGFLYFGPSANPGSGGGTAAILQYNGTYTKRFAAPANMQLGIFESHKNYLFGVDVSNTKGNRLWWSASLDGTSWPSTNFVDVAPQDGDTITALISHNGILYIFKKYSIWALYGDVFDPSNPSYSLSRLISPQGIGATNGETVKKYQDKIIFLATDGVYAIVGVNSVVNISGNIRTTVRAINQRYFGYIINGSSNLNPEASAVVYDNRYWLSFQATAASNFTNDTTICLEPNGAWTKHTFAFNNMVLGRSGVLVSGAPQYLMIGLDSATWNLDTFDGTQTNDGSSAINSTWSSKVLGFGDFTRTAHVEDVYVMYYNTTNQAVTLKVFDDSGQVGSSTAWTFPGGTTQFITVQRFAVDRDTNGLYLTVTDNTSAKSFRVMGIAIRYWKEAAGSGVVVTS